MAYYVRLEAMVYGLEDSAIKELYGLGGHSVASKTHVFWGIRSCV
jgi:hypothetical protein